MAIFDPDRITKQNVIDAIKEIDENELPLRPSTGYDVVYNGTKYPPKELLRHAYKKATGENNWEGGPGGGEPTNKYFKRLGFEIIEKNKDLLGEAIQEIRDFSKKLWQAFNNKEELVNQLNDIGQVDRHNLFLEMKKRFDEWPEKENKFPKKQEKRIRYEVSKFLQHKSIDVIDYKWLEKIIGTETKSWYMLFRTDFLAKNFKPKLDERSVSEEELFRYISDSIIKNIGTELNAIEKEKLSFKYFGIGKRNGSSLLHFEGETRVWLSIFNKVHTGEKDTETTAKQLFIAIDNGKISYGLIDNGQAKYDLYHPDMVGAKIETLEGDNSEPLITYFKENLSRILNNATMNIKLQPHEVVYKISMGPGEINEEAFNYFMDNKLVVVHGETKAKGTSYQTQGDTFANQIKVGDYFYLCKGNKNLVIIGKIISDAFECEFENFGEDGWLQRSFEIISKAIRGDSYQNEKKWWTPNDNSTCIAVPKYEVGDANNWLFLPFYNTTFEYKEETPLIQNSKPRMEKTLNQILYGPPGTGKTFQSLTYAVSIADNWTKEKLDEILSSNISKEERKAIKERFDIVKSDGQIEFITFHQNYSYEDFVQGLKPDIDNEQLRFRPHKGIFYDLTGRARENYLASKERTALPKTFDMVFAEMVNRVIEGKDVRIEMASGIWFKITDVTDYAVHFEKSKGDSLHTLSIQTLRDIIEGRRKSPSGLSPYYYPLADEIKRLMKSTEGTKTEVLKNFIFIIDEINRANISRVFGELITLIEADKRLGQENHIEVKLPSGELFSVPPNLYIVGTMNTADKSIALVDIALRRRFDFVPMYPQPDLIKDDKELKDIFIKLNKTIYREKRDSADFLIGHSYFMGKKIADLPTILENRVIPLLNEYFMNDSKKVIKILDESGIICETNEETYQIKYKGIKKENK